jgi:hypothetical protein
MENSMAKAKTKKAAQDTTCTQNGNTGGWLFSTQGFDWEYVDGIGPNLLLIAGTSRKPVGYFRTLNEAVCFAWGFTTGFNARGQAQAAPEKKPAPEEHSVPVPEIVSVSEDD